MVHTHLGNRKLGRSTMLVLGLFALASSARAQTRSDVPAGSLIFSRDVPARAAQAKEPPGTADYVGLDQTVLINGTLGVGFAPLADQEISGISAGSGRVLPVQAFTAPEGAMLAKIPNQIMSGTDQLSSSPVSGTAGLIGAPLQAINQAMSVLNAALTEGH